MQISLWSQWLTVVGAARARRALPSLSKPKLQNQSNHVQNSNSNATSTQRARRLLYQALLLCILVLGKLAEMRMQENGSVIILWGEIARVVESILKIHIDPLYSLLQDWVLLHGSGFLHSWKIEVWNCQRANKTLWSSHCWLLKAFYLFRSNWFLKGKKGGGGNPDLIWFFFFLPSQLISFCKS